jgi:GMP synthase (glutamine-hydrolysing)
MLPFLVIENDRLAPAGRLGDALAVAGMPTAVVAPLQGDPIPEVAGWSGIVVLGGHMGAYETDRHRFLEDELRLIREAVAADVPVLGICLGAQLIAAALGGRAYLAPQPEVAVLSPTLTDRGRTDPLADHLRGSWLVFHQDTFDLPPGAELLAFSDACPQAFRHGSALALQPHPEASPEIVDRWFDKSALPGRVGVGREEILDAMRTRVPAADAAGLFAAWLDEAAPAR